MIYLMLYLFHVAGAAVMGGDLTPAKLIAIAAMTVPGWVAVWYSSRKPKGSLR
jgi:hypothetical protein